MEDFKKIEDEDLKKLHELHKVRVLIGQQWLAFRRQYLAIEKVVLEKADEVDRLEFELRQKYGVPNDWNIDPMRGAFQPPAIED